MVWNHCKSRKGERRPKVKVMKAISFDSEILADMEKYAEHANVSQFVNEAVKERIEKEKAKERKNKEA